MPIPVTSSKKIPAVSTASEHAEPGTTRSPPGRVPPIHPAGKYCVNSRCFTHDVAILIEDDTPGTGRPLVKGNDITFHFTHPPILVLFYPISTHMTMCCTYFEISSSFQCQKFFFSVCLFKKTVLPQEGRLPCFGQNVSTSSSTVVSCAP